MKREECFCCVFFISVTWFKFSPSLKIKTNCGCWSLLRTIIVVIHQSSIAIFSFREWEKLTWLFDFYIFPVYFCLAKELTALLLLPGFVLDYIANCWINTHNPKKKKNMVIRLFFRPRHFVKRLILIV